MSASPAEPLPDDGTLIRQFLKGDETAFRTLYRRHTPRLRMVVLRLVGYRDADADDVLQEAWLAASRALAGFRGEARFETWLSSIAIRTARRRMARAFADGEPAAGVDAVLTRPGMVDAAIDAEQILQRLPDRSRIVFTLHYLQGLSHDEIAGALGIAASTSRAILSRALGELRARYRIPVPDRGES
ncbi:MAG TPA: RNA polymerase sigma factor [Vicinamibacterales bacterium]|nr:RNA polymerase sigma factor [Vicinamibacterales bacterium]